MSNSISTFFRRRQAASYSGVDARARATLRASSCGSRGILRATAFGQQRALSSQTSQSLAIEARAFGGDAGPWGSVSAPEVDQLFASQARISVLFGIESEVGACRRRTHRLRPALRPCSARRRFQSDGAGHCSRESARAGSWKRSKPIKPAIGEIQMNLFARAALRPYAHAIADDQTADHQLRIDRGAPSAATERLQCLTNVIELEMPVDASPHGIRRTWSSRQKSKNNWADVVWTPIIAAPRQISESRWRTSSNQPTTYSTVSAHSGPMARMSSALLR
jgi:hypothetical protein